MKLMDQQKKDGRLYSPQEGALLNAPFAHPNSGIENTEQEAQKM